MSSVICQYRVQERRPGNYFALGIAMAAIYVAWAIEMPKVIWVLVAVYLGLVLLRLVRNSASGFRLKSDRLEALSDGVLRVIPLPHIESFRLSISPMGPALCLVSLDSGEVVPVRCGSREHAKALAVALDQRGIPVA